MSRRVRGPHVAEGLHFHRRFADSLSSQRSRLSCRRCPTATPGVECQRLRGRRRRAHVPVPPLHMALRGAGCRHIALQRACSCSPFRCSQPGLACRSDGVPGGAIKCTNG